jgi:tRNA-dihydrouridine synthase
VNLAGIRAVVDAVKTIPVIGNGDVTTPEAAKHMLEKTGCAGVSMGRGALYDPWIFKRTRYYLATGKLPPEPAFAERLHILRRHFELMVEVFGEELGCRMFRKVAPWYAKRFGPASAFNKGIVHIARREDFEAVVEHYLKWREQFLDENGELKPHFRPAPLVASFMTDDAAVAPSAIPVPKGPVEVW